MSELYSELARAVTEMDEEGAERLAKEIVREGLPVIDAIEHGLVAGMEKAGELYEN
ncbi:MAG: B12-binding domain-containing protein [Eubacteriales bacterium]